MMKAFLRRIYGPPDVLELKDIDNPVVKDDGGLVRVRAASLNAANLDHRTAGPRSYAWAPACASQGMPMVCGSVRERPADALSIGHTAQTSKYGPWRNVTRSAAGVPQHGGRVAKRFDHGRSAAL